MSHFFFAIKPNANTKAQIIKRSGELTITGRPVKPQNIHLTLVFLGPLPVNQMQHIIEQAKTIHWQSFQFELTTFGCFKKSRVAWLGVSEVPTALLELQQQLANKAKDCEIQYSDKQYLPHVTLSRKAKPISLQAISPIRWPVSEYVLFESKNTSEGIHYEPAHVFPCS